MIFLKPYILWALLAIAIPIIIHLFNFKRYRKVYFSNLHMLKEVKLQSKKQSQLRQLLILAMRILTITALVVAFAKPLIPGDSDPSQQQEQRFVSLFFDNSFSMQSDGENSSLLEEARNKARTIVGGYEATDKFLLLTNDFKTEHCRLYNQADMLELIEEVELSPASQSLTDVLDFQSTFFEQEQTAFRQTYILSDFQESQINLAQIEEDSLNKLLFIPIISSSKDNVYIDSVWFDQPILKANEVITLKIQLQSKSANDIDKLPINLFVEGQRKGLAQTALKANANTIVEVPFKMDAAGNYAAYVSIDDYPITYDNNYHFSFELAEQSQILEIVSEQASEVIERFYQIDSSFAFTRMEAKAIDYSAFSNQDLIVINNPKQVSSGLRAALTQYLTTGGKVLFIPSQEIDIESYNTFFTEIEMSNYLAIDTSSQRIAEVDLENEIYKIAFDQQENDHSNYNYPTIRNWWKISGSTPSTLTLLAMNNGQAYLESKDYGQGTIYRLNNDLGKTSGTFHQHALLIPTLLNIASFNAEDLRLQYTLGEESIMIKGKQESSAEDLYSIRLLENEFFFIPGMQRIGSNIQIQFYNRIKEAGVYSLYHQEEQVDLLAFNYDRKESDLSYFDTESMEDILAETNVNYQIFDSSNSLLLKEIQQTNDGRPMWKLFIVLALVFLLIEVLLLRFLKLS